MYRLSSCVLGSMITALVLTPFVSGPDRSFVGSLLATPAPEQIVSVNRALKADRQSAPAAIAGRTTPAQTIRPKTATTITPASLTAPAKSAPQIDKAPAAKQRLLDGCESAFSEITDRQLANIAGRCMASLPQAPMRLASTN